MSLDAVREALLAQAEAEAKRLARRVDERAAAQVKRAEKHTAALVQHARGEGEAAAALEATVEMARARRAARAHVLRAQREVFDNVRRAAYAAAELLRSRPEYADLLERLIVRVQAELGKDVELDVDPPAGGVVGRHGNRRVDYTLPVLVERCLADHATDLERLWT